MAGESKQLSVLYDLSRAIIGASSMEEVCRLILDRTVSALNVDKASIMKLNSSDGTLKIVAARGLPRKVALNARVRIGEGISGKVFKSARPILIRDIRAAGFEARKRYISRSLMSAPVRCFSMRVGKRPIGVINVTDKRDGKAFTADDLKLLNTIANQTASYLHLCDLAEEAKESERIRRELEMARAIQQRLLPRRLPKVEGFDIAGKCLTAERVGGDYFDVLAGGARPPAVVVADVAGHSISAAMMMSAFRSAVRCDTAASFFSPAIAAERLNAILYEDLAASEQFISMVYLQIMPGAVKYTTAGHHPPLIMRGGGFINHSTEDFLLGVERYAEYHEKRIETRRGDLILLFTDGLVSVMGFHRLKTYLKKNKSLDAQEIVNSICKKALSRKKSLTDDVTAVAIRVL